jgi:hypothetical protein
MVSSACLLSPKTVAAIRSRPTREAPALDARVGRDGKVRPIDPAAGRRRAAQVLTERPELPLRAIAREAGVSPSTAANVRARIRAGKDPVQVERSRPPTKVSPPRTMTSRNLDPSDAECLHLIDPKVSAVRTLEVDRSFRDDPERHALLAFLETRIVDPSTLESFLQCVPLSRVYVIADIAHSCEAAWGSFARALEQRAQQSPRATIHVTAF